ncbi:hypothetical protein K437DRAFT_270533 [Tilletiaria anomala UBC 951]|uniref:Uncharacterized protein n=1 Tax=Tilletiaria anomala (strain ATCC 24038 / CBS 436.72 / UBC 951) TaxID=1037660 RepID=A0A066V9Z9_TILAU|nr:uncharacterized protein K437DRAFT_270533 [Tilletiaria anomala UBC 951]KDN38577.1 hypothetical protein K437DRAFT_270533 [Tilletiaria anomala UBC 951]
MLSVLTMMSLLLTSTNLLQLLALCNLLDLASETAAAAAVGPQYLAYLPKRQADVSASAMAAPNVTSSAGAARTVTATLFVPSLGADGRIASVSYWNTGNNGTTVYKVLYTNAASQTATAVLLEDSRAAQIISVQRTLAATAGDTVAAGASCGFDDGFGAQGYCANYQVVSGSTSTFFTGGTRITAATTVTNTLGTRTSSAKPSASAGADNSAPTVIRKSLVAAAAGSIAALLVAMDCYF